MPVNERPSLDGQKKVEMVKKLHESVQQHIEKKNEQYANKTNKGRRQVIFEPGDWVWVHMRKESVSLKVLIPINWLINPRIFM